MPINSYIEVEIIYPQLLEWVFRGGVTIGFRKMEEA